MSIDFFYRAANSASSKTYNTLGSSVASWNLQSSGVNIHGAEFDITPEDFKKWLILQYEIEGLNNARTHNFYTISYSDSLKQQWAEGPLTYAGSRRFTENDVQLTVNYSGSTTGTLTVVIWRLKPTIIKDGKLITASS